jgi:probable rRNA maturation factor
MMLNYVDHLNTAFEPLIQKVMDETYRVFNIDVDVIVNVILVSDAQMKDLNLTFAQKDKTTDVLTFPSTLEEELGDIFISIDQAQKQADALGHSLDREVAFLCVHGALHCLGFTHESDDELQTMIDHQETILEAVGQPRSK